MNYLLCVGAGIVGGVLGRQYVPVLAALLWAKVKGLFSKKQ